MRLFDFLSKLVHKQKVLVTAQNELMKLYINSGGYNMNSESAEPVKEIGRKLNEAGGFKLMLKAHEDFAARKGRSLARNLEQVWDGIGSWRG